MQKTKKPKTPTPTINLLKNKNKKDKEMHQNKNSGLIWIVGLSVIFHAFIYYLFLHFPKSIHNIYKYMNKIYKIYINFKMF